MAIVGRWRLINSSVDTSGNGYNGTDHGLSYNNAGYANFDGNGDYIDISTSACVQGSAARSGLAEVKPNLGANSAFCVFSYGTNNSTNNFVPYWSTYTTNGRHLVVDMYGPSAGTAYNSATNYADNMWHTYGWVYTGGSVTTTSFTFMLDNLLTTASANNETPNTLNGAFKIGIKFDNTTTDQAWIGGIRNVMFFNHALTVADRKNYHALFKGFYS